MSLLLLAPSILHPKNCFPFWGNKLPETHRFVRFMAASSVSPLLCCHPGCSPASMLHLFRTNYAASSDHLIAYSARHSFQLHKDHGTPKCWQAALLFVRLQAPGALVANPAALTAGHCSRTALSEAFCPALSSPRPSNASHLIRGLGRPHACS
jgi:hypothetical protein